MPKGFEYLQMALFTACLVALVAYVAHHSAHWRRPLVVGAIISALLNALAWAFVAA